MATPRKWKKKINVFGMLELLMVRLPNLMDCEHRVVVFLLLYYSDHVGFFVFRRCSFPAETDEAPMCLKGNMSVVGEQVENENERKQ